MSYDMVTEARARIDKEIAMHVSSACNLRFQRNALSPISRLPPEVLAVIFIDLVTGYYKEQMWKMWCTPTWVNVSYVCRHWRDIALHCLTLWSYHFTTSLRWTEELLSRSRQTPLKICISFGDRKQRSEPWWSELTDKLMDQMDRIEELRVHLPPECLLARLSSCAPRLQILEIVEVHRALFGQLSTIFQGQTPALHTLKLANCVFPSHSLILSGLTVLFLEDLPSTCRLDIEAFLSMLRSMQDLTSMYLENALVSAPHFLSSQKFYAFQKINLPRLARLVLSAPLFASIASLSCINIPLEAKLRLMLEPEKNASIDDYAPISQFLAQRYCTPSNSPPIRLLVVNCDGHDCVCFTFNTNKDDWGDRMQVKSRSLITQSESEPNVPLWIAIWTEPRTMKGNEARIISDMCLSMPLVDMQSLCVINPPSSPPFWKQVLGHLKGLRCLVLTRGLVPDLASILSLAAHDAADDPDAHTTGGTEGPEYILAPALETLFLSDISSRQHPQPLFTALSSRKQSSGCLMMKRFLVGREDCCYDVSGQWEEGLFRIIVEETYSWWKGPRKST